MIGNATIVTLLAKNGGNPNTADLEGYTPLHNAAWHNKLELIRYLISYGAKINVQESTGSTPLRKAAYRGHLEAAKMLLGNSPPFSICLTACGLIMSQIDRSLWADFLNG